MPTDHEGPQPEFCRVGRSPWSRVLRAGCVQLLLDDFPRPAVNQRFEFGLVRLDMILPLSTPNPLRFIDGPNLPADVFSETCAGPLVPSRQADVNRVQEHGLNRGLVPVFPEYRANL